MYRIALIIFLLVGFSVGWTYGMKQNEHEKSTYCKQMGCENEQFHN